MKEPRTLWTKIQLNLYGCVWVLSWFVSIWWEPYRWPLFWTGMFALFIGIVIANGTDDASHSKEGEQG